MAALTVSTAEKCTKRRIGGDISDLRHSCLIPQMRRRGQTPVGAKAEPPWVSRSRPHVRDGLSAAMPNVYREILKRLAASAIARRAANLAAPALSPYPPGQANAPGASLPCRGQHDERLPGLRNYPVYRKGLGAVGLWLPAWHRCLLHITL